MRQADTKPVVVKLGGSLDAAGTLAGWLAVIAETAAPIVVVPGGGAFADAVRAAQARTGCSDPAAHGMALLAMDQRGLMLADIAPGFQPAGSLQGIRDALAKGRIPVWLPSAMSADFAALPADWSLTSDGLAAWLANRLQARAVWLVKSVTPGPKITAQRLAVAGIVDPVFAALVDAEGLAWRVFGPGDRFELALALAGQGHKEHAPCPIA